MSCADAGSSPVRRFEVFTGVGKRRSWAPEDKAAIIAESYSGVESVCAVARRHGLRHTQLFTWRREMRRAAEAAGLALPTMVASEPAPMFVTAVVEPEPAVIVSPLLKKRRVRRARATAAVELEIDGVTVKIARGADAGVIAAVIDVLKTKS